MQIFWHEISELKFSPVGPCMRQTGWAEIFAEQRSADVTASSSSRTGQPDQWGRGRKPWLASWPLPTSCTAAAKALLEPAGKYAPPLPLLQQQEQQAKLQWGGGHCALLVHLQQCTARISAAAAIVVQCAGQRYETEACAHNSHISSTHSDDTLPYAPECTIMTGCFI